MLFHAPDVHIHTRILTKGRGQCYNYNTAHSTVVVVVVSGLLCSVSVFMLNSHAGCWRICICICHTGAP